MEGQLVLLASLVLVLVCRGVSPELCDTCVRFECEDENEAELQNCETRWYDETDWITTQMNGCSLLELLGAKSRLDSYCSANGIAGGWPVLVSVTEDEKYSLSYFVNTSRTPDSAAVTWETKPSRTVHVRIFGGFPSTGTVQSNAQALWDGLKKDCTLPKYIAAGYPKQGLSYHNEVWIDDADVC